MSSENDPESSRRITSSEDLEVSAYLEIAQEKAGRPSPNRSKQLPQKESILVVDFGSQYSRLIARRIRESKVYCEIVPHTVTWESVKNLNPKRIVLSGGPSSVYDDAPPLAPTWVYECGLPTLGICYGMQVMVHQLGGKIAPATKREYGHAILHQNTASESLLDGLPPSLPVWMSHADQITELPPGFKSTAYTDNAPIAVTSNGQGMTGIQFHPEVVHTPHGIEIIQNFLRKICGVGELWTSSNFVEESIRQIKEQVGDGKVICALSGGVDSAVAATLVHRAVGNQLTCIFFNNGLMR